MAKHRKPTDPTLRLVATGTVIVSAGLGLAMLGVGTAVAAAQPAERGANGGAETRNTTGAPTNPNGFRPMPVPGNSFVVCSRWNGVNSLCT